MTGFANVYMYVDVQLPFLWCGLRDHNMARSDSITMTPSTYMYIHCIYIWAANLNSNLLQGVSTYMSALFQYSSQIHTWWWAAGESSICTAGKREGWYWGHLWVWHREGKAREGCSHHQEWKSSPTNSAPNGIHSHRWGSHYESIHQGHASHYQSPNSWKWWVS